MKPVGSGHIFTLPYYLFVNTRSAPRLRVVKFRSKRVRVYPPFRSAPANFVPLPSVVAARVPYLASVDRRAFANLEFVAPAVYPDFHRTPDGKTGLLLAWGPNFDQPVTILPMDSLRIDVLTEKYSDTLDTLAKAFQRRLLTWIRHHTHQWWVGHSASATAGELRASFAISSDGRPLAQPWGNVSGSTIMDNERPIDFGIWNVALDNVEQEKQPDLSRASYLDAIFHETAGNIATAVLMAITACELKRDDVFAALPEHKTKLGEFKRGKAYSSQDLRNHLDLDVRRVFGRSLKQEDHALYSEISELWIARNNVAHGNRALVHTKEKKFEIDRHKLRSYIVATRRCLDWLEALRVCGASSSSLR